MTTERPELASPRLSIEIPRDSRGRIRWLILSKDPEQLHALLESEARKILEQGYALTKNVLARSGNYNLLNAIQRYYPGRISALKANLSIEPEQKPSGYWIPAQVEEEALAFYGAEGKLTGKILSKRGRCDLNAAIAKYPGQMRGLKVNLDISQSRRPDGYWTPETIEQEARQFFNEEGQITQVLLSRKGKADLAGAIGNYPGGLVGLKQNLGIELSRKPDGYWTPERIEEEALAFYQREGRLGIWVLAKRGGQSLLTGIRLRYPGGIRQLRKVLGIPDAVRPSGYWTPEEVERQAREFYEREGNVTLGLLSKGGRKDLVSVVRKKYPGGIQALREKLGIKISQEMVSPEEANEQLRSLLDPHL